MNSPFVKFFIRVCILLALIFAYAIDLYAQLPERELAWKNLTTERRNSTVYTIFCDNDGLIWLGTDNGLYFYDGVSTHNVGKTKLGDYRIYALSQKDNQLFAGTNNGLFIMDYSSGKVEPVNGELPGEIRSLLITGDNLWIGSIYGIYVYNLIDGSIENLTEGLNNKSVYSILKDSRGILYAGTYNGLARWDSVAHHFNPIEIDRNGEVNPLFINCMLESADQRSIYIGGENYLYKYTPSTDKWEKSDKLKGVNVKSLSQSQDGHLIIGTDNGLFDLYNDSVKQYRHDSRLPQSISHNEIWSVYCDDKSNIWAGHERGFSIASNSEFIKRYSLGHLTDMGEGNEINNIKRDKYNNLWLGGSNGVILLSSENTPQWFRHKEMPSSLSHNRIRDIMESENGNIWLATDGGINRYEGNNKFRNFHISDSTGIYDGNWAYSLVENGKELLIGSFLGGILGIDTAILNTDQKNLTADISINTNTDPWIRNNLVNRIIKDGKGNIWALLFRDNSLVKFSSGMEKIEDYEIYEMTGGYPTHIVSDSKGRVWCGFKGGAVMFDDNKEPVVVVWNNEEGDETIIAMGKVKDDVWISTRSNLWKLDGETLEASLLPINSENFTSIYEDPFTGKVLLGGIDEIVEVNEKITGEIQDFRKISLIVEKEGEEEWILSDFNKKDFKLKLPYKGSLNLIISPRDYSPGVLPHYRYKLAKNITDTIGDWHRLPEGSNKISLSDLKMGKYYLMIKTEGSTTISLKVPLDVESPPALSWWAITLYSIIFVILFVGVIMYVNIKKKRILESKLREAELENAEKKLSFLSSISHDLKTPLSMIIGPVSLMKEKVKDEDMQRSLETVYQNAMRLNSMVHKTIELQHVEDADESVVIMSTFDIVEFAKSIFEIFKENNTERKFIFLNSEEKIYIEADAVKLESIINNLLSNACKYSYPGSIISMGVGIVDKKVEIRVSDDGMGISEEDKPLIFHKMFRSPSISNLQEGTGLGLYLIKRYIELMGGDIEVNSRKGEGSTFIIGLPLSHEPDRVNLKNCIQPPDDKKRILIVEDNLQIANFLMDFLKKEYSVIIAENGRSGLSLASSFNPDLIIADEMMPVMSGLEMSKRLKENSHLSSIPIIMLTAKTDNITETESIKRGIDVFMTKPFDPKTLKGRIEQLIKRKKEIVEKLRIETILENESKPIIAESINEKTIANIIRIIEENISDPDLNVEMLCKKSGLSSKNLYRLIKKTMGKAPLDFIRSIRLQKAASLLSQKRFTVSEVGYMVGFKTPSYFTKCFQNFYGMTPSEYMAQT